MIYTIYKFRYRIGLVSIISGLGGMTIGVIVAHFAGFPKGEVIDYFNWIPIGWLPQAIGQLLAFGASQLLLLGGILRLRHYFLAFFLVLAFFFFFFLGFNAP